MSDPKSTAEEKKNQDAWKWFVAFLNKANKPVNTIVGILTIISMIGGFVIYFVVPYGPPFVPVIPMLPFLVALVVFVYWWWRQEFSIATTLAVVSSLFYGAICSWQAREFLEVSTREHHDWFGGTWGVLALGWFGMAALAARQLDRYRTMAYHFAVFQTYGQHSLDAIRTLNMGLNIQRAFTAVLTSLAERGINAPDANERMSEMIEDLERYSDEGRKDSDEQRNQLFKVIGREWDDAEGKVKPK